MAHSSRSVPPCGFKLKGTAIRGTMQAIERLHGEAGRKAVEERLPPEHRELLAAGILTAGWYPIELSAATHLAVRELFGAGAWSASRAIGREAAKIDFGGVYRVLLRAVPHATMWERVGLAFRQYNSGGTAEWTMAGPGTVHGLVRDVSGYNEGMWEAAVGRLETMLERSGARARSVTIVESSTTFCRTEVLWLE